jgi:hypothetical protein
MKKNEEYATKVKRIRNMFLIVLGFLTVGAIGGGVVLIISPTGEMIGMPLSEFKNIPFNFNSFLISGIILLSVLGLIPLLLIIALQKKPESKIAISTCFCNNSNSISSCNPLFYGPRKPVYQLLT